MVMLLLKDFELGTKISDCLAHLDTAVVFWEEGLAPEEVIDYRIRMVIIDLDDSEFGNEYYISVLKNKHPDLVIVGYMKLVHKETHDKLKASGCDFIIPRRSLVKNIPSLIKNL